VVAYPLNVLSLCSGVGMLDLAIGAAFDARTVCYVEREAFSCAQLVNLMEAGCMDEAPIWSDLATFDGRAWRGAVDIVVAGLPCQPYSVAGKRQGNTDHRSHGEDGEGPIPHALRIIDEVRPAVVYLENVPAWVAAREQWFKPVGERLSAMGYRIERPLFLAASDVGASHRRERVFLMAYCPEVLEHTENNQRWCELEAGRAWSGRPGPTGAGNDLADTSSPRSQGSEQRGTRNTDRGGAGNTWIN